MKVKLTSPLTGKKPGQFVGIFVLLLFIFSFAMQGNVYAKRKSSIKKELKAAPLPKDLFSALRYRNIGPFRGGRSVAVAGNAKEPRTFYFGGAAGGVWKTIDGGITWRNVSDKYFKTAAVGALAVAPSDPNVIYAGMGGPFFQVFPPSVERYTPRCGLLPKTCPKAATKTICGLLGFTTISLMTWVFFKISRSACRNFGESQHFCLRRKFKPDLRFH